MIGRPLIILDSVGSTNNYLAEHPDLDHLAEGTAIMARSQTSGKGQGGNVWQMAEGRDLAISYLLRPSLGAAQLFRFNKQLTLSIRAALEEALEREVKIKWPNDIMVGEGKLAGLLIEVIWSGLRPKHIILGLGVNVGARSYQLPQGAISMAGLGFNGTVDSVAEVLSAHLSKGWDEFLRAAKAIDTQFDEHLWKREEMVTLEGGSGLKKGTIHGVDPLGRLLLQNNGEISTHVHGEWRIVKD